VFRPRLLLMDAPMGALDKQSRESPRLEMRRPHADFGITFIHVTHDQEEGPGKPAFNTLWLTVLAFLMLSIVIIGLASFRRPAT
jgi:ABC-type molybdenum transport system ATPase subunit/photorepair protein PhrA